MTTTITEPTTRSATLPLTRESIETTTNLNGLHGLVWELAGLELPRSRAAQIATTGAGCCRRCIDLKLDMAQSRRAHSGLLFLVTMPGQQFADPANITIWWRKRDDPTPDLSEMTQLRVFLRVAAVHRNEIQKSDRLARAAAKARGEKVGPRKTPDRPVTDESSHSWVKALLSRQGFDIDDATLSVSPARQYGRRRLRFPVRDLVANVTVVDEQKATEAWQYGIGAGKNYGLGMLVKV